MKSSLKKSPTVKTQEKKSRKKILLANPFGKKFSRKILWGNPFSKQFSRKNPYLKRTPRSSLESLTWYLGCCRGETFFIRGNKIDLNARGVAQGCVYGAGWIGRLLDES